MVHRLDPRYPLVWRTPTSIQVGVDPPQVVLDSLGEGAERMLAALVSGATPQGLTLISRGESPDELLLRLAPVLEPPRESGGATPAERVVAVSGLGPTAALIARLLGDHRVRLGGFEESAPAPDAAVMCAHYALPPQTRGTWLRRDVPHLAVVFSDTGAVVGPLIRAGGNPCLTCVELHHRDLDPAWPAVASQLLDRSSTAEQGVLTAEAAAVAVRMLLEWLDGGISTPVAIRIDASTGERTSRPVGPHPQCLCTETAAAPTATRDEAERLSADPPRTG